MFRRLGHFVTRYWPYILVVWCGVFLFFSRPVASLWSAPAWNDVVRDGDFRYLPEDMASRKGEKLFEQAFPDSTLGSTIVIIASRENSSGGLQERDFRFIREVLTPRLREIAGLSGEAGEQEADEASTPSPAAQQSVVTDISTLDDEVIGDLLLSDDRKATLIHIQLTTEFQESRNQELIEQIEALIAPDGRLGGSSDTAQRIPDGLALALSGSATFGRDMKLAAKDSAEAIHLTTLLLVFGLLLLIYRSPVLVFVPLLTVYVSVFIAIHVLVILADAGILQLFQSAKVYVTVVMYGAGVDYCMFLMARYKEELDGGATIEEAIALCLEKVGAALTASAGTVMCGIGMMVFAQFGKFQQAGVAMSLSLVFVLLAALTFTPAILRLAGRWAFWPQVRTERISAGQGWLSPTSLMARLLGTEWFRGSWKKIGEALNARPGTIWVVCILLMTPFAVVGVLFYGNLSYGLISELPDDKPSVIGTAAVQKHFPAGTTGPVTILIENPEIDFSILPDQHTTPPLHTEPADMMTLGSGAAAHPVAHWEPATTEPDAAESRPQQHFSAAPPPVGYEGIRKLTDWLKQHKEQLHIADIRSIANPLGITPAGRRAMETVDEKIAELDRRIRNSKNVLEKSRAISEKLIIVKKKQNQTAKYYVSSRGEKSNHVTRVDVVFDEDPFSHHSIDRLDALQQAVHEELPPELGPALRPNGNGRKGSKIYFIGTTASIRDLKSITGSDQVRIDILVIAGVFLILVILLRRPAISAYLIVSVFFSYLVTLGVTFTVFYLMDPAGFTGLDWKVPMFLFTILIAVGEDYNIFLMTRIEEEQEKHGPTGGVTIALLKTGGIISSCGLIMAGTFSSLISGSLDGMIQLGFALAFGVLLDTFVVRPILVPAYLILLHKGRFGALGKFLGAESRSEQ